VDWYRAVLRQQFPPAASSGGVAGPPGVSIVVTNHGTAQLATLTVGSNSGANRMDLVVFSFYPTTPTFTVTNSTAQSATYVTTYYLNSSAEVLEFYAFTNPPTASHTVSITFSSALTGGGWIAYVASLTNCSSAFGPFGTNYVSNCSVVTTNILASANNQLVIGDYSIGYSGTSALLAPTLGASQTIVGNAQLSTTDWQDTIWKATGATSSTNTEVQSSVDWGAQSLMVCVKGF
jgi:hypothetical protein